MSSEPPLVATEPPVAAPAPEECWENEGGHMSCSVGPVLYTAGAELPYQVVLIRPLGQPLCRSFATMRQAEAFIRRNSPVPPPVLSTLYDRPASES